MGQTTVDLPDPSQSAPVSGTATASADDLLSQLAGEDIDRLLAEAEADFPPARVAPQPIDDAEVRSPAPTPPAEDKVPQPPLLKPTAENDDLDTLLNSLTASPHPPVPAPDDTALLPDQSPADAAQQHADEALDKLLAAEATALLAKSAADEAAQREAEERAALMSAPSSPAQQTATEPGPLHAPPPSQAAAEEHQTPSATDDPLPAFLLPLEWLSAPLNSCSDSIRDAIGKIAILTTVNALAVLAYVLFFRRH